MARTPARGVRGVRLEIRLLETDAGGSIYASPAVTMSPGLCRIDLLESAPGAADRMHWHPVMAAGEPGVRTYDPSMSADPAGWLSGRLHEVQVLLKQSGVPDVGRHRRAALEIEEACEQIVEAARAGLDWAREPWPTVDWDGRLGRSRDGRPARWAQRSFEPTADGLQVQNMPSWRVVARSDRARRSRLETRGS